VVFLQAKAKSKRLAIRARPGLQITCNYKPLANAKALQLKTTNNCKASALFNRLRSLFRQYRSLFAYLAIHVHYYACAAGAACAACARRGGEFCSL
jgi:ABC-type tungstate transport system permease subunit